MGHSEDKMTYNNKMTHTYVTTSDLKRFNGERSDKTHVLMCVHSLSYCIMALLLKRRFMKVTRQVNE